MRIRNAAKALIVRDGRLLLQRCRLPDGAIYYELPGGGQRPGETMEEAVRRECLEETGYTVRPAACCALLEEMLENSPLLERYPGYAHRVFHIFRCEMEDVPRIAPPEEDDMQIGMDWVPLEDVAAIALRPSAVRENLARVLEAEGPLYLGSLRIRAIV